MLPRILCLLFATVTLSAQLWAHPGHGVTPADEPVHYIAEPIHGWPILLAAAAAILAWRRYRSRA